MLKTVIKFISNYQVLIKCKIIVGLIFLLGLVFIPQVKEPLESIYYFVIDRTFRAEISYDLNKKRIPNISVILFDQKEIGKNSYYKKWPVDYSEQANLLLRICEQKPSAIVYDMHLVDGEREDADLLKRMIEYASESCADSKIPIILSKPENIDLFISEKDDIKYGNVNVKLDSFGTVTGYVKEEKSISLQLFKSLYGREPGKVDSLVWPLTNVNFVDRIVKAYNPFSHYSIDENFPVQTFFSSHIINNNEGVNINLKGSVVFVGANVNGTNDIVTSNTYGQIPGVYFHVTSFMNYFINAKSIPKSHIDKLLVGILSLIFIIVISIYLNNIISKNKILNTICRKDSWHEKIMLKLVVAKTVFHVFGGVIVAMLVLVATSILLWVLSNLASELIMPYISFFFIYFLLVYPWVIKCKQ